MMSTRAVKPWREKLWSVCTWGALTFKSFLIQDDRVVLRRLREAEKLTSETRKTNKTLEGKPNMRKCKKQKQKKQEKEDRKKKRFSTRVDQIISQ